MHRERRLPRSGRARAAVLVLPRVPWSDVVAVEPPDRWRDRGVARRADGREVELLGTAPDEVARLAAALTRAQGREGQRDARE